MVERAVHMGTYVENLPINFNSVEQERKHV